MPNISAPNSSQVIAALLVVALLVLIAYVWYNYMGWTPFTFTSGDVDPSTSQPRVPSWMPEIDRSVGGLRFHTCTFYVRAAGGATVATKDVTAVLNGMAAAYEKPISGVSKLTLAGPLNPYSFPMTDVAIPPGATAVLTGYFRSVW